MKRFKYLTMAALVGLWACDSGTTTTTPPAVTGTISGTVTVEGTGASGVTVTLSSGTTATTGADGTYTFSAVNAGAYTVTISGFASDATFDATAKAATITTAGQVATVNFAGSYIKTSSIVGVVTGGTTALSGVKVTLGSSSTTTGSAGEYSFSGLRKGSYTVVISGYNSTQYSFSTTSQTVTVGVGESKVVSFTGTIVTTASITGRLFLDENNKDDTYTPGLEDNLSVANVSITLEGNGVSQIPQQTTMTAADGTYSFANLAAGNYRLTLDKTSAALPGNVAFGGISNQAVVGVSAGGTVAVNWPFDITQQAVKVYGYLGIDGTKPGVTPIKSWAIDLYDTEANAAKGNNPGKLNSAAVTTDANGQAIFRFKRATDVNPNGGASDGIVFARVAGPNADGSPAGAYVRNGERVIEIKFNPKDSVAMAPDTFDALYSNIVLGLKGVEIDGDLLAGWIAWGQQSKDTLGANNPVAFNSKGMAYWNVAGFNGGTAPDTFWVRVRNAQSLANGHGFNQTATGTRGTVVSRWLKFIWDGTVAKGDTVMLGTETVKYTDADILVRMFHEADDSNGVATFTGGDDFNAISKFDGQLYRVRTAGPASVVAAAAFNPVANGWMTFPNQPVDSTAVAHARRTSPGAGLITDSIASVTPDGGNQADTIDLLHGKAGAGTFAVKFNNNTVTGNIFAADGVTAAAGLWVHVVAGAWNVGSSTDTLVKVAAGGGFTTNNKLLDGPYTVTVADSVTSSGTVWSFFDTLKTTPAAGSAKNTDERTGMRTVEGGMGVTKVNFKATRMDTKVQGIVAYDRDQDYNTLDPDEALAGVSIELYSDTNGNGALNTGEPLVTTATTDANGAYGFSWLREGKYIVKAISPTNATVLRALSGTGGVTNTVAVTTAAVSGTGASATYNQNGTRQVGNMSPPAQGDELPRWNYITGTAALDGGNLFIAGKSPNNTNGALTIAPAHFVHLFKTGTVTGTVKAAGVGVSGVTVTLTRCWTSATAPSPPALGTCTKEGAPTPNFYNLSTDANGKYTFTGLLEGVYLINVAPATAGYTNIVTPGAPGTYLATLQGNNDVETAPDFVIS